MLPYLLEHVNFGQARRRKGERDATAYHHLDERARVLGSFQPAARFEVIAGAGHWVQYEAAERFNPILAEIAGS